MFFKCQADQYINCHACGKSKMTKALDNIITGEITTATRSVEIDEVKVETGQVIALLDGKLVTSASSVEE